MNLREKVDSASFLKRVNLNLITRQSKLALAHNFQEYWRREGTRSSLSLSFSLSGSSLKGRLILPGNRTSRSESIHVRQSHSAFGNDRLSFSWLSAYIILAVSRVEISMHETHRNGNETHARTHARAYVNRVMYENYCSKINKQKCDSTLLKFISSNIPCYDCLSFIMSVRQ